MSVSGGPYPFERGEVRRSTGLSRGRARVLIRHPGPSAELAEAVDIAEAHARRPAKAAILPSALAVSARSQREGSLPSPILNAGPLPAILLQNIRPDLSASTLLWPWQKAVLCILALAALASLWLEPSVVLPVATVLFAGSFLAVLVLRVMACANLLTGGVESERTVAASPALLSDARCPTYAVLVPLYDEAEVVPGLVAALERLDYPKHKLAISFIVETSDAKTREAFARQDLSPHMRVIVAPPGVPRTKPRALNFALAQTPGRFVVVFDAEDLPEPDQLRRAVVTFARAPGSVACLQSRLNTINPYESFLSRHFTLEYSVLFDLLLPALERIGFPIPLGGTSNHFRRTALEAALAWDPHNVTEDADLGIRLARFGMKVGVLASTTWEDAPVTYKVWRGQRTRWHKGWMQTYIVHMRQPWRLMRELGVWPFIGFQLLMGSMIASALVHPWFYLLLGMELAAGHAFVQPEDGVVRIIWWLAVCNLALGYLSAMGIAVVAAIRRGRPWLAVHVVTLPIYWLLISLAAHRALRELVVAPHYWEKTAHRARPLTTPPARQTQPR